MAYSRAQLNAMSIIAWSEEEPEEFNQAINDLWKLRPGLMQDVLNKLAGVNTNYKLNDLPEELCPICGQSIIRLPEEIRIIGR